MTDIKEWCDDRLANVLRGVKVTQAVNETFSAVDGSDAHGSLRVLTGDVTVVDSRLAVPSANIDSAMLHAFSPSDSLSPHLLSDLAVMPDGHWHFHVDLMPRVDLVESTDYLDQVYPPLTRHLETAYALPGSAPIAIPLRLRALSSAWLIGVIASAHDAPLLTEIHDAYVERWMTLLESPPTIASAPTTNELVARDSRHRTAVFSEDTDPVWGVVGALVGTEAADLLIRTVRG